MRLESHGRRGQGGGLITAVTKRKAEMVVTWHERGVTPQEASALIRQHAAERERRERAERMRPKFIEPLMF